MEAEELRRTCTSSSSRRGCLLEARGITYDAIESRRRRILDDVSVAARPSELLAVVGPSGAGKSTLLRFLSGRLPLPLPSSALLLDGQPLPSRSLLLRLAAFVPQHDPLHPLLTPRETLLFAARLRRVPADRADRLLAELRIPPSSAPVGALSGGERRRLSVAVEAVHDPPVLVLDEATSGLDSGSALQVVEMLRGMAEGGGKTVVVSVHQPGSRMIKAFGAVAVMAAGRVVHQGTVEGLRRKLGRVGVEVIPLHVNVVELAMEHVGELAKVVVYEDGGGRKKGATGRCTLGKLLEGKKDEEVVKVKVKGKGRDGGGGEGGGGNWWMVETAILTHRNLKNISRTKELFLCRTMQMLISGLVLGSIFYRLPGGLSGAKERVGLFAFTLAFLLSSTTEALPIFLQERQILLKETSSGTYRISAYSAATALAFLPFLLVLALLFSVPVYWLVGLNPSPSSFSYFTLLIWLILYTANSVVSCFASVAPDFVVGNSLVNGVLGAFFLFSGYFIRKEGMPSYWVFMHYLSLFKYPLEGFLVNEFSDKCLEEKGGVCLWRGGDVLREVGLGEESRWRNVGLMVGLILLYRLLGYVFLRCRCSYEMGGGLWRALGR